LETSYSTKKPILTAALDRDKFTLDTPLAQIIFLKVF